MTDPSSTDIDKENHPLLRQDGTSLLTLSRTDLSAHGVNAINSNDEDNDPLVLMQLPSSLSIDDLCSAQIMAKDDQQACLVVEKTGKSFAIGRVETSNCLVLAPPPCSSEEPPSKRIKSSSTSVSLSPLPVRLLQPGGSESSFLEMKEREMSLKELALLLQQHVFSPYNGSDTADEYKGRTLEELALQLQCSNRQVQAGLNTLVAFGMPRHTDATVIGYGVLSEEAAQEAKYAIVATLTECDEFVDFSENALPVQSLVKEAVARMESDEAYPQAGHVVRHCLKALSISGQDGVEAETVLLDFDKVALCVAERLFQTQSQPWEESAFLSRWHSEVPGVDKKPSVETLHGVAICTFTQSGESLWKYFPHHVLPSDAEKRFDKLFVEKERWTLQEIEPYLKRLVQELSTSQSELLLQYTRVVNEDVGGVSTKYYVKR